MKGKKISWDRCIVSTRGKKKIGLISDIAGDTLFTIHDDFLSSDMFLIFSDSYHIHNQFQVD